MTVIDPPQREVFIDKATDAALSTPDAPRTPEAVERAWSARERAGRVEAEPSALVLWNFDVGAAAPKLEHDRALERFFAIERLGPGMTGHRYTITGAASVTGAEQTNATLSGRRAEVAAELVTRRFGIPGTLIRTRATGEHAQVASTVGSRARRTRATGTSGSSGLLSHRRFRRACATTPSAPIPLLCRSAQRRR